MKPGDAVDWDDYDHDAMELRWALEGAALRLSQEITPLLREEPADRAFAALVYELARILADLPSMAKKDEMALRYRIGSVLFTTAFHIRHQHDCVNGCIQCWDLQWYVHGRPAKSK